MNFISKLEKKYNLYSFAQDVANEVAIRDSLDVLYNYIDKSFNILRAGGEAGITGAAKTPEEKSAKQGHFFCKELLNLINTLHLGKETASLDEIKENLLKIKDLISSTISVDPDLKSVSDLIFMLVGTKTRFDRKQRDGLYSKARTGVGRINGLVQSLLQQLKVDTSVENYKPKRSPLNEYQIRKFLINNGERFGITSQDDWSLVWERADDELRNNLLDLINQLERGFENHDTQERVMDGVSTILTRNQELTQTNEQAFEDEEN